MIASSGPKAIDSNTLRHKLAELRKGMEQLQQQALLQQGAIAVLEELLRAEESSTAEGAKGAKGEAAQPG